MILSRASEVGGYISTGQRVLEAAGYHPCSGRGTPGGVRSVRGDRTVTVRPPGPSDAVSEPMYSCTVTPVRHDVPAMSSDPPNDRTTVQMGRIR